jgi:hypothetical protein
MPAADAPSFLRARMILGEAVSHYRVLELLGAGGMDSPQSVSFAGASFPDARVFHVRITSGNTPLAQDAVNGNGVDVVAMDDFIHGERQSLAYVSRR